MTEFVNNEQTAQSEVRPAGGKTANPFCVRDGAGHFVTHQLGEIIFETTHIMAAYLDPQFNFLRVNRAYAAADDREPAYYVGKNHFVLYPDPENEAIFRQVIETGEPHVEHARPFRYAEHPERGITYWDWLLQPVKESGAIVGLILTLLNVTERKLAEEALQESEQRFRRLVESVTDYIYTVTVENGRPVATRHGPGCITVTGYRPEDYERDPHLWHRMIHEADRQSVVEELEKIDRGLPVSPIEHRIVHKSGAIRWIKNTPVPRYDERGVLLTYDGLISDISERKRLEEQFRQAQKLEAIGQLAGGVAHDFNNILSAVIGYAHLLLMKLPQDDPNRHAVEQILESSQRGASLTQSLLAFSRKRSVNLKINGLNDIMQNLEKLLLRILREDIRLTALCAEKELPVMADRSQIEQVIINLVTNARDAMPNGGHIEIETRRAVIDEQFTAVHGYGAPGEYACLIVSDTGSGMDEAMREKIFEPFFTTKEQGKGTGLGLAVVYGIIKQHNGYVDVYSEPGKGSAFKIYLPLAEPGASVKAIRQTTAAPIQGGTETILVAEDDDTLRKLATTVLSHFGYSVIEAADGEEAISRFIENKDRVRLVILDGIMPKKNGKEACDEIRLLQPDIKVIFASGYSEDVLSRDGISVSGATFLLKPIAPSDLLKTVREILDGKR